jgi:hypothetical protein
MFRKHSQQNVFYWLFLLQFIFGAVVGQCLHLQEHDDYFHSFSKSVSRRCRFAGLHFWEHSYSQNANILQHNFPVISACPENFASHDSGHCAVCSFYQSLQITFLGNDLLSGEYIVCRQFPHTAICLPDSFVLADRFLRAPPFAV